MASNSHEGCETCDDECNKYLIVNSDKGGLLGLFKFLVSNGRAHGFIESSEDGNAELLSKDHRWVIVVSIIVRIILGFCGKPMQRNGVVIEFVLNLLSLNGGIPGLFLNLIKGRLVVPKKGSDTFISVIGHLDPRVDLFKGISSELSTEIGTTSPVAGNRALLDLCVLASKVAYENANVVKNIVEHRWKMHFVEFYNCWNDYQKERSTQVFIACDKPIDASLVLISFRGTEPFDADDWSTDVDYSWYEIPKLGKVHMGFLEALGLGNRAEATTFKSHITPTNQSHCSPPSEDKTTAYYAVRNKLKWLLNENKNAKFIMTGHSLGGALAILFPTVLMLHDENELMKRLLGIYTFGQPRIGDHKLKRFMEDHLCHPVPKYFRVVYNNDIVPRLPYDDKIFLYKHFGVCLYYDSFYVEQNMDEEPNRNYFGLRYLIPEYINAFWELIRGLIIGYVYGPEYKEGWFSIFFRVFGLMMPGISAHCPRDYVNCVRLGQRKEQMTSI